MLKTVLGFRVQRYLTLRQHLHEKHGVESSDDTKLLWFSASKPRSVRLQNKRSMMAKSMLAPLFPDLELEVEWKKGVIWAGKSRIAAAFPVALAAMATAQGFRLGFLLGCWCSCF